jgi:starch-binding outer membrane protein, SusD/RagB family
MKHYKILASLLAILILFSCKKVIEIKETDFIGGDIALKTVNNNEQVVIGAYAGMGIEMGILLNATFADEVKKGEFYNSATAHEWQYSSTDIVLRDNFTAFPLYYRIIDRVNRVLQALPKADSTRTGDEVLRSKLRGEALFLRAFCHFELFRYYCGNYDPAGLALAYVEVPSLDPQARITMGPYFTKLTADLNEAKSLLPNSLTDVGRANRLAASGLQARVALYMRDWSNAVNYSNEYIAGLPLSTRATFNGIWTDANNNEVAFELKRTASIGTKVGSLFRNTSTATLVGTITWLPSDKLTGSYDKINDVRYSSYFKTEPLLTATNRPALIIQKYGGTAYGTPGENVADAKVFRTGEMYLIRAEAKAENGDLSGAAADINALRTARIADYQSVTFASKDALISAILLERFKELAYESHRFWDLKRRNLPVERLASDAPTTSAVTLPANNFRFLLPIPNTEILANRLIQQNPGYTN